MTDSASRTDSRLRVCSFESRRGDEMSALIERYGGLPTVAPSMREVPLDEHPQVLMFAEKLLAGEVDIVVFLTGVGAVALLDIAAARHPREEILAALGRVQTIVRGPKPAAVLRQWNVPITLRAPEPNTWRELVGAIDDTPLPVEGKLIALQEYGEPAEELSAALTARGAEVMSVPVYRWTLPADLGPLESAIRQHVESPFDLVLFTSAQQVRHVLQIAEQLGCADDWRAALRSSMVASIGPTCSEALAEAGLQVDLEPSHPKMGTLVREALEAAATP